MFFCLSSEKQVRATIHANTSARIWISCQDFVWVFNIIEYFKCLCYGPSHAWAQLFPLFSHFYFNIKEKLLLLRLCIKCFCSNYVIPVSSCPWGGPVVSVYSALYHAIDCYVYTQLSSVGSYYYSKSINWLTYNSVDASRVKSPRERATYTRYSNLLVLAAL